MDLKHVHPLIYLLCAFAGIFIGAGIFSIGESSGAPALEIIGAGFSLFGLFCGVMTFITTCIRIAEWDKKNREKK